MKKTYRKVLWAGSEESLAEYQNAVDKFESLTPEAFSTSHDQEESLPRLLTIQEGVAVVEVKGTLTNVDTWWNEYAGLVSYNEVREALLHAVADESVTDILMDISSPGGTTYGLADAAANVAAVNKIKPITVFSDSLVASAAYWLASAASKRVGTPDAHWGSIGVILSHVERSKAMKDAGYTPTIIRGGKYKALGHPNEPLTTLGKEELQKSVDYLYELFVQSVSDNLGNSYKYVDANMAQGREFIGTQAKDVGLVDSIESFDEVFNNLQRTADAGGDGMKKKYALTAANIAAIAAGGEVEMEATDEVVEVEASTEVTDPTDKDKVEASADKVEVEVDEAEVKAANETEDVSAVDTAKVELMTAQVTELNKQLLDANVKLESMKSAAAAADANLKDLCAIVAAAIGNMEVALGGAASDHSKTVASDLVAAHTAIMPSFLAKYKVGGVAASAKPEDDAPKATITSIDKAKFKSVGLG